ncbi:LysR family transcriptional regulator [Caenimonas koreensis]|uniref:LysR family transcriptional regulator n=1 Tax=Caenimonas koreensis DSM 17982 TaxID=1121255 RepID=A0A844B914_9BURK|nr:LysR family transcriptional regulator [Caenimonas koreensis]MRD47956.1 LysR family transcriptional regulator [Caenimonas koreensis DSM 17982]
MELYQIRYFLAVAETLNFTRASERSFVSQPALTKGIQRLEETIGGRLFDRTKSAVQLTELGRRMLPNFSQIYETANHARSEARRLVRAQKEVVRVGVMCTIDFHQVLPGFVESQEGRSEVELSFREGNLEALSDALDEGDVDVGIMCSPYEIPKRFTAMPLFREEYVLAIGDDHRFSGRTSIDMTELQRERYCERVMCEFSTYIERLLRDQNVVVEVVQQSSREDWIQAFVRANFGVAFMPISLARAARLAYVTMTGVPIVREVNVLTHAERPTSTAQRAVIDSLVAYGWGRGSAGPPEGSSADDA